ncbi:hypothetical protein PBRA_000617 [Plasmodiophora brassicae]|uniref:Uncharacterized protein n=1 Tax=Plasmodiophora brassicae TaxID=37360 RepID=A0A0G4IPY7_PLABS|nr:hypothetical protein PBRA_000617 [Plasmodiophora brassicae]
MGCGVGRLWVFLVGAACLLGTRAAALGVVERLIVIRDQLEVRRTDFIISAIQQIDDIIAELSLSDPGPSATKGKSVGFHDNFARDDSSRFSFISTAALSEDAFLMTPGTPRRDYNFLYQEFEEMETKLKAANQKVEELHERCFELEEELRNKRLAEGDQVSGPTETGGQTVTAEEHYRMPSHTKSPSLDGDAGRVPVKAASNGMPAHFFTMKRDLMERSKALEKCLDDLDRKSAVESKLNAEITEKTNLLQHIDRFHQDRMTKMENEMGQAVVQLRQCEEREQKVHKKLSTSLSELDGARRFIDRLRQRATGADADRQRLLASIAEMTEASKRRETQQQMIVDCLEQEREQLKRLNDIAAVAHLEEKTQLQSGLAKAMQSHARDCEFEQKCRTLQQQLEEVHKAINQSASDRASSAEEHTRTTQRLAAEIDQLKISLDECRADVQDRQQEIDRMGSLAGMHEAQCNSLSGSLVNATATITAKDTEIDSLKRELNRARDATKNIEVQLEGMRNAILSFHSGK